MCCHYIGPDSKDHGACRSLQTTILNRLQPCANGDFLRKKPRRHVSTLINRATRGMGLACIGSISRAVQKKTSKLYICTSSRWPKDVSGLHDCHLPACQWLLFVHVYYCLSNFWVSCWSPCEQGCPNSTTNQNDRPEFLKISYFYIFLFLFGVTHIVFIHDLSLSPSLSFSVSICISICISISISIYFILYLYLYLYLYHSISISLSISISISIHP